MPRLSIIIPLLGDPAQLDDTLVSVLENRPANCEILVVHNEPYDDPYGLAGEVRFLAAAPGAALAECLNLGLRASRAAVVHVLSCGVEVSPGWAEAAIRHFRDAEVAAVAAVVLSRGRAAASRLGRPGIPRRGGRLAARSRGAAHRTGRVLDGSVRPRRAGRVLLQIDPRSGRRLLRLMRPIC